MACLHKFHEYLTLERLDFEPTTLIVGTFNPAWPAGNPAQWFYGRTHDEHGNQNNNFWEVLPRLYGKESLINATPVDWKAFCKSYKIAITDLISCIDDADEANVDHIDLMSGFADDDIATRFFDLVNIVRLFRQHPSISNIYITCGFTGTFWKHKVYPIKQYCDTFGVNLKPLITPSGYAYLQQGKFNRANRNAQLNLPDYILMRWQEQWHL